MSDQEKKHEEKNQKNKTTLKYLIENNEIFTKLKKELKVMVKTSQSGITNFFVNYEDPLLVNLFLDFCYDDIELYNGTHAMDSVELQKDAPGQGKAIRSIDEQIYGTFKIKKPKNDNDIIPQVEYDVDEKTQKRKRNSDGFVSRKVVTESDISFTDRTMIIRNIDLCQDFCPRDVGNVLNGIQVFDNFRNNNVRKKCNLILVTNTRLKLPFKIRTLELNRVDDVSAEYIIDVILEVYRKNGYEMELSDSIRKQIARKLTGLTYTESCDIMFHACSVSNTNVNGEKKIDPKLVIKNLREKVNANLMEDGFGLSHLTSRPWEDYICPESSNFTYDVKKIMRDINEVKTLIQDRNILDEFKKDSTNVTQTINSIQMRMPHVIVLYGKGGVGKSAFPIHFAGLLGFDVWDFNIGASHSKWVGEGAERMRETLKRINKASHVIVRIDEYDRSMGSTGESGQGMHEAHKQVEAEFMNWLQNSQEENIFVKNNIFVILTTNHKENITGPLLRSGRADLVIDIDNFDGASMKEAFQSVARRNKHRGVSIVGFDKYEDLQSKINSLDLTKLSEIAMAKGFTVRDIDVFIMEMAAHYYYFKKGKEGFDWTNENFTKILSKSQGSTRDTTTGELTLGDRYMNEKEEVEKQLVFTPGKNSLVDPSKLDNLEVFEELK